MHTGTFRDFLPEGIEPHASVVPLMEELEAAGWLPRQLINGRGLKFYPDNQRPRQILVDLLYPPNDHKLAFYREHTQLDLLVSEQVQEKED
jgi:hypothetical protein